MLFLSIVVFVTIGLMSYGFLAAKRTLADKQASLDAIIQCLDEQLTTSPSAANTRVFSSMGDELQTWLRGLREATARLQKQCNVAAGFDHGTTWEDNIEKTVVPAAWLTNLERTTQTVGTYLDDGSQYADEAFLNEMFDAAVIQASQANDRPFREIKTPVMNKIAAVHDMSFFIVKEDGTFIVPRESSSEKRNEVWTRYHAQLVNEMRQQEEGWLYYPPKAVWQIDQPQYALRFMTIGDTGAVVAVETYLESELSLLGQVLNKKVLAYFMGIFLIALIVSGLIAYIVARRLDGFVTEFTGKSYGSATQHKKGFTIRTEKPLTYKKHQDIQNRTADDREALDLKDKLATLKKAVYEQAIDTARIKQSDKPRVAVAAENVTAGQETVKTSRLARQDKAGMQVRTGQKTKEVFYDDITLDMQGIRSSELKKLIGEFRDGKSNDTRD
jgi:hypothetical protein